MNHKICPLCGHKEDEHVQACSQCGTRLAANEKKDDPEENKSSDPLPKGNQADSKISSNKRKYFITGSVFVILAILMVAIAVPKGKKAEESFPDSPNSSYDETEENSALPNKSETQKIEKQEETMAETVDTKVKTVTESKLEPATKEEPVTKVQETYIKKEGSEYVLPESNSRYLTYEDLNKLSAEECRLARNELFARYGRRFNDEGLQAYFDSCSWYKGTIDPDGFDEKLFNKYEIFNRDFIVQYEKDRGYR